MFIWTLLIAERKIIQSFFKKEPLFSMLWNLFKLLNYIWLCVLSCELKNLKNLKHLVYTRQSLESQSHLGNQIFRVRLVLWPKIIASLSACKKWAQMINSFLRYSLFYCPMTWVATPIFDHCHSKTIEVVFSFPEAATACKISFYHINSFLKCSQF